MLTCIYCLHSLIYTYVLFILIYELDKIVKTWGIQKLRRNVLKSISSIEDNYLEAGTGDFL